jgi:hypothetical protein
LQKSLDTNIWNGEIDGGEFELFIRELLQREPGVRWIRQVSASNEPDGRRDLICEWITPPLPGQQLMPEQNPYFVRRVIVQCKARKKSVGKSEISDIRDTIDHHEAHGFFVAVSTNITRELTEYFEKLRYGGRYWIDWWTRSEIEERLLLNLDIVERFPNVVRVENGQ